MGREDVLVETLVLQPVTLQSPVAEPMLEMSHG